MAEYSPRDYSFPVAYVEGVESTEYLIPILESRKYRLTGEKIEGGLGRTVYEEALSAAVDLENAVVARSMAVRVPWKDDRAMYVAGGTSVHLVEVGGLQTVFYSYEGDDLEEGDVLAYVLTSKGETRTIRVEREATVFYVAWVPGSHPPTHVVVLVDEENLIILEPSR